MANIIFEGSRVFTWIESKALAFNIGSDSCHELELPSLLLQNNSSRNIHKDKASSVEIKDDRKDELLHVVAADFSMCGKWLILYDNLKCLSLWRVADWSLVSQWSVAKSASKVKFTPTGEAVVLADKSGDVYLYSTITPGENAVLLLGHLSVVLDVVVTPDEKYIITCDRDEKIRVSRFPNAYSIVSFCMGHDESVTALALVPHCASVLISSSQDGTLRFWNYVNGKMLLVVNCSVKGTGPQYTRNFPQENEVIESRDNAENNDSECEIRKEESSSHCDSEDIDSAVKCLNVSKRNKTSLLSAYVNRISGCLLYEVSGTEESVSVTLLRVFHLKTEPLSTTLRGNFLWTVMPLESNMLNLLVLDEGIAQDSVLEVLDLVSLINKKWNMFKVYSYGSRLSLLYGNSSGEKSKRREILLLDDQRKKIKVK